MRRLVGAIILSAGCFLQGFCREAAAPHNGGRPRAAATASAESTSAGNGEVLSGADHYGQANYLKAGHESEEALREYQLAIESGYDTADVRVGLGDLLRDQLNREDEAIEQFRIAVQRDKSHFGAHSRLAQSLLSTEQYDEALRELNIVKRLDPEQAAEGFYAYQTAKALDGLGRYDEALTEYEQFLANFSTISPLDPDVLQARDRIKAINERLHR
jgi:tetratricopeptide (TPR) repeat protein